jgi:hypothetical protein
VTEGWKKLHKNEELRSFYSFPNIIRMINSRRMKLAGHVAHFWVMRNAYKMSVGKPEAKRPLGRTRNRREDRANIKMDLTEIGWKDVDWIHLAQDRDRCRALVNTVMKLRVPQNAGNFFTC